MLLNDRNSFLQSMTDVLATDLNKDLPSTINVSGTWFAVSNCAEFVISLHNYGRIVVEHRVYSEGAPKAAEVLKCEAKHIALDLAVALEEQAAELREFSRS